MLTKEKLYIAGQWVSPSGRETIDVHNAGNGEVMGRIPAALERDAAAAVRAAREAFESWSSTPAATRADYLQKIADGLKSRSDELARTIAQEVGMPLKLAGRIQVGLPIANFANYAKLAREFKWEERVGNSLVVREAVGVVAAITPWNYPLHQITLKVAPALAAGCTVVLKPSEVAPFNAFVLAEVMQAVGLPKGVFNLVTGFGPSAGEALVKHPGIDMISFTGSTPRGQRLSQLGPLSSQAQLERVRGYIKKGLQEGAELIAGGAEPPEGVPAGGYYVRPTVFGRVKNDMTIAQEEIFGPVLAIIPYRDEEEAVRLANDTVYGLAGAVWSKDDARAQRVARRIRAGQVDVNGGAFNINAPFGGFKQSGHGREAGVYGLEEFLEYKSLQLKG